MGLLALGLLPLVLHGCSDRHPLRLRRPFETSKQEQLYQPPRSPRCHHDHRLDDPLHLRRHQRTESRMEDGQRHRAIDHLHFARYRILRC